MSVFVSGPRRQLGVPLGVGAANSTLETMGRSPDSRGILPAVIARVARAGFSAAVLLNSALFLASSAMAQPTTSVRGADGSSDIEPSLELVNLDLLDSRDGYAIPADSRFLPGERVHVYFQIKGYRVGRADRIFLRYEVAALDPNGRRFYSPASGEYDVELAPQDKNWMPVVRYSPRIPDHAGGGTYVVQIAVHDQLADETVEAEVPILVDGERVERADELLVRNFRFSKTENGDSLSNPEFRPGEEIWAAFFITGYETRENNTFDVESDAWVIDSEGERLFGFEPSGEGGRPYYPRLWLPAKLRLDLDETIPPGRYTVVLRLRDRVAGSEIMQRYSFWIR